MTVNTSVKALGWPVLPPLRRVDGMSADDFSRLVAQHHAVWATLVPDPVITMAGRAGAKVGTVHFWIWQARQRGLLPPGPRGGGATRAMGGAVVKRRDLPAGAVGLHRRQPMARGPWRRPKRLYPVDVDQLGLLAGRSIGWCEVAGAEDCTRKACRVHRRIPAPGGRHGTADERERDRLSNLLHVCPRCLAWIEEDESRAMRLGLVLPDEQEPTAVVVWYRTDPMLLDDAGGVHPVETAAAR
jgi:hypothetical protein